MPLLYNLQQNTETAWPSGSSAMASFLSEQAPSPMLISSSSETSTFYSHVQYEIDEKRGGEISGCMYALQAHHFSGQLLSSADTRLNRPLSAISLCKVANQTSPAKMMVRVSVSCPQGECVDWQLQAAFADQKRLYLIGRREVYLLENVLLESSVREGGGGALHNVTVIPLDRFFVSSSFNDSTTGLFWNCFILLVFILFVFRRPTATSAHSVHRLCAAPLTGPHQPEHLLFSSAQRLWFRLSKLSNCRR